MPKTNVKRAKAQYPAWLDHNMTAKHKRLVEDATSHLFMKTGTTAKLEKNNQRPFVELLPSL